MSVRYAKVTVPLLLLAGIVISSMWVTPLCACTTMAFDLTQKLGVFIPDANISDGVLKKIESATRNMVIGKSIEELQQTNCSYHASNPSLSPAFGCGVGTETQDSLLIWKQMNNNTMIGTFWLSSRVLWRYGLEFNLLRDEQNKFVDIKVRVIYELKSWVKKISDFRL